MTKFEVINESLRIALDNDEIDDMYAFYYDIRDICKRRVDKLLDERTKLRVSLMDNIYNFAPEYEPYGTISEDHFRTRFDNLTNDISKINKDIDSYMEIIKKIEGKEA